MIVLAQTQQTITMYHKSLVQKIYVPITRRTFFEKRLCARFILQSKQCCTLRLTLISIPNEALIYTRKQKGNICTMHKQYFGMLFLIETDSCVYSSANISDAVNHIHVVHTLYPGTGYPGKYPVLSKYLAQHFTILECFCLSCSFICFITKRQEHFNIFGDD